MDNNIINELAVNIGKISYLYKNIRKSGKQPTNIEIRLLKKYITELYDGIILMEQISIDELVDKKEVDETLPIQEEKIIHEKNRIARKTGYRKRIDYQNRTKTVYFSRS